MGDDDEVLVIDAAHDADAIMAAVGERRVTAILCTHGHNDHIDAAPALADRTGAAIWLHPADAALWGLAHPERQPNAELHAGQVLTVAGMEVHVLHTPGHSPGGVCLSRPGLGVVFTGDTLFAGGPGATGRSFSDFPTIIDSISHRLLNLPATPWCTPATATTPPSAQRPRTWTTGSSGVTERRFPGPRADAPAGPRRAGATVGRGGAAAARRDCWGRSTAPPRLLRPNSARSTPRAASPRRPARLLGHFYRLPTTASLPERHSAPRAGEI